MMAARKLAMTLTLATLATPSWAQPASAPAEPAAAAAEAPSAAEAEEASITREMKRGLSHYGAGEYAEAIRIWLQLSARLPPARRYKLDYNLGLAQQASAHPTEAHQHFERFVTGRVRFGAPDDGTLDERAADARGRMAQIVREHGAVYFAAFVGPGRAVVSVAGATPRVLGFRVFLPPGPVAVTITTPDGRSHPRTLSVVPGQALEVPAPAAIAPRATPPPPPVPVPLRPGPTVSPPDTDDDEPFPLALLLIGGGITAASFGLPAGLWQHAVNQRQDTQALGRAHPDYPEALDDYAAARTGYYASYALPVLLAAATTAIVVVDLQPSDSDTEPSSGLALSWGPGGVALGGHF